MAVVDVLRLDIVAIDRATKVLSKVSSKVRQIQKRMLLYAKATRAGLDVVTKGKKSYQFIDKETGVRLKLKEAIRRMATQEYAEVKAAKKEREAMHGLGSQVNSTRNAFLGLGLTMLFGGMAIKRFTGTILRDLVNVYMTASGQNSVFTNGINRLRAHLILMKFALLDAFSQTGIIEALISMVISVANWFAKLPAWARRWIVIGLAILFVVGVLMGFLGQMMLLGVGVIIMAKFLFGINSLSDAVKLLSKNWKVLLGWVGRVAGVFVIVIAAAYLIYKVWHGKMSSLRKWMVTALISIAAVALAVFVLFGGWIPIVIALFAIAGVFIIATWDKVKMKFEIAVLGMKIILGEFISWALKQLSHLPHAVLKKMGIPIAELREKWGGVVQGYKNRKAALELQYAQKGWWETFKENMGFGGKNKPASGATGTTPWNTPTNSLQGRSEWRRPTTIWDMVNGATKSALSDLGVPTYGMIGMGKGDKATGELTKQTSILQDISDKLTKQGKDVTNQTTTGLGQYGVVIPDASSLGANVGGQ